MEEMFNLFPECFLIAWEISQASLCGKARERLSDSVVHKKQVVTWMAACHCVGLTSSF